MKPARLLPLLLLAAVQAHAADIRAGMRAEPTIDPHVLYLSTNIAYARHMFEPLVGWTPDLKPQAALATEWRPVNDTTWEFRLRDGVKFHDGSDFTAEDVAFTVARVPSLPNNPNSYASALRTVQKVEVVDPHTVRFTTEVPNPSLPQQMSIMSIVSHAAAAQATPSDFASGKAAVGTGPYRFARFVPGSTLELTRYDGYWGPRKPWDRITFRVIANDAAREAALLTGDVDIIDYVPPADVARLGADPRVSVFTRESARVIYLAPNVGPDRLPGLTTKSGAPLDRNPLKDVRVRQAISLAVDRNAIVTRIMEGMARPASQLGTEGIFGYDPALPVPEYNPAKARALLQEAGWPDGFGMSVTCSNDRYIRDAEICQAIGQMLSRIGIAAKVETLPLSVFFPRIKAPANEFPLILAGWSNGSTGSTDQALAGILHSYDTAKKEGVYNNANFSDPELDAMIDRAVVTLDDARRAQLLQSAMQRAMQELGVIPLHIEKTAFAARKGITYEPRVDEQAFIMDAKPAH